MRALTNKRMGLRGIGQCSAHRALAVASLVDFVLDRVVAVVNISGHLLSKKGRVGEARACEKMQQGKDMQQMGSRLHLLCDLRLLFVELLCSLAVRLALSQDLLLPIALGCHLHDTHAYNAAYNHTHTSYTAQGVHSISGVLQGSVLSEGWSFVTLRSWVM